MASRPSTRWRLSRGRLRRSSRRWSRSGKQDWHEPAKPALPVGGGGGGGRMSVTVRVPTILRTLTGGESEVAVDGAATLAELLDKLDAEHPGIRARVHDDAGKLRGFVNVYVGEDAVRFSEGLQTATPDGATVSIIPAVAGGCPPKRSWATRSTRHVVPSHLPMIVVLMTA